jgi:hypothetical protein
VQDAGPPLARAGAAEGVAILRAVNGLTDHSTPDTCSSLYSALWLAITIQFVGSIILDCMVTKRLSVHVTNMFSVTYAQPFKVHLLLCMSA